MRPVKHSNFTQPALHLSRCIRVCFTLNLLAELFEHLASLLKPVAYNIANFVF